MEAQNKDKIYSLPLGVEIVVLNTLSAPLIGIGLKKVYSLSLAFDFSILVFDYLEKLFNSLDLLPCFLLYLVKFVWLVNNN